MAKKTPEISKEKAAKKRHLRKSKPLFGVLGLIAVIAVAFFIGRHYGQQQVDTTTNGVVILTTSKSSKPPTPSTSEPKQQPTQQSLKNQTAKATGNVSRVLPSNGHIILSGTVEKASTDTLEVKTRNGQIYSLYVGPEVHISGKTGSSKTVKDTKPGTQVTVSLSLRSDGAFQVRTVRAY